MSDEKENKNQYQETVLSRWVFRICAIFFIILFCYFIIHLEFNNLKNSRETRESAEKITSNIDSSIEKIQDAWNTMYYFYQTGDLMKIMKCAMPIKNKSINQENTLLMLYREDIKTKKTSKDDSNMFFNDIKNVSCGGNITINVGLKNDIYDYPIENKTYTFKLGEEPLELLEKYIFIKEALSRLHFGEQATFIALPAEKKMFKFQKHKIYELSIPYMPSTEIVNTPLYMAVNKSDEKFSVDDRVVCGSVVQFLLSITDINGKKVFLQKKIGKVKVGSGLLNDSIEQIMTQMKVGERYKILLTKQMFKKTPLLNDNFFHDNEIVIVDLVIANVQK